VRFAGITRPVTCGLINAVFVACTVGVCPAEVVKDSAVIAGSNEATISGAHDSPKNSSGEQPPRARETIVNSIGMKLVYIPPGTFMMGDSGGTADEKPVHRVQISKGFWMGQTEVTQAEYQKVTDTNPSGFKNGDNRPVEQVSWDDAMAFCQKLSANEGKTYTLPTEAQWEYACRAGTTTRWAFGDSESDFNTYGWCGMNSGSQTHPVGKKKANPFNLFDMCGNVWEWCLDWYGENYYENSSSVDPQGPHSGAFRVLRGGSWVDPPASHRSGIRGKRTARLGRHNVGFRVVCLDSLATSIRGGQERAGMEGDGGVKNGREGSKDDVVYLGKPRTRVWLIEMHDRFGDRLIEIDGRCICVNPLKVREMRNDAFPKGTLVKPRKSRVLNVIGPHEILAIAETSIREPSIVFHIRGVQSGLVNDEKLNLGPYIISIGTYEYAAVSGASRTVPSFVMPRRLTREEFAEALAMGVELVDYKVISGKIEARPIK